MSLSANTFESQRIFQRRHRISRPLELKPREKAVLESVKGRFKNRREISEAVGFDAHLEVARLYERGVLKMKKTEYIKDVEKFKSSMKLFIQYTH